MLTGLIPLHFNDCLPFSVFSIADINKINSADFNTRLMFGSLTFVTPRSTILTTRFCLFEISTNGIKSSRAYPFCLLFQSMFAHSRKAYFPRSGSGMRISTQEYHPMACESKSCRYSANSMGISCAEFKFVPQYTFSMIDYFHHVHCLTIRRTAIARKHRDEIK